MSAPRQLHPILAEAVFLSGGGGVAGIVIGMLFSIAIACHRVVGANLARSHAGGFVFSAAAGIFFGFYLAR
jgi:macrolide transport system ATP-binding/permease protein